MPLDWEKNHPEKNFTSSGIPEHLRKKRSPAPLSFDYRAQTCSTSTYGRGWVSPVKDQGEL